MEKKAYNGWMTPLEPSATPAQQRQTQSYLRDLFRQHGLNPKKKLGQNFLVDLNLIDLLVRSAELDKDDFVLEVGTGTGSLTSRLAAVAGCVLTVEIDSSFGEFAERIAGKVPHVRFHAGDVLKNKNHLEPKVLAEIAEMRDKHKAKRLKLVANLPYAVATPVISNLLLSDLRWDRMVVTVQWEIADKMTASPSTKAYGALSVLVQSLADVEVLRKLPPDVFWPKPKVDSGIIRIVPNPTKRALVRDPLAFRIFLRDLYSHRRKNLRGALLAMPASDGDKPKVDALIARLGYDGTERAETLDVKQHRELHEAVLAESGT
jgi:16S rRNA (adenine1518-N6/adenine1519-N6)-dimethyltransferase